MKITKMTPNLCNALNIEIKEALAVITKKHGLTVDISGSSYNTDTGYNPKIHLGIVTEDGIPADFKRLAPIYSLMGEDYGKEVRLQNGHMAKIARINKRRPKYPISVTDVVTGKSYKMSSHQVLAQLGRPEPVDLFAHAGH